MLLRDFRNNALRFHMHARPYLTPIIPCLVMSLFIYLTLLTAVDALFGSNALVAVIDSGVNSKWITPRHVESWLSPESDDLGHGTAVTGVISSRMPGCPGAAPRAVIYSYRTFGTQHRTGHPDWLDGAVRKVLWVRPNVLNLSHGDAIADVWVEAAMDRLVNAGITVVASAGNHGTHLSPARIASVISVGVHNHAYQIGERSAHGWSPTRSIKPDLVAFGIRAASISSRTGTCSKFTGTSYSAPLVTAAIAMLVDKHYPTILNPGHIRQILYDSATRVPGYTILQQGFGRLDTTRALAEPIVNGLVVYPRKFYLINDCVYMRPFCDHRFGVGLPPLTFNLTMVDSRGPDTTIIGYEWWGHDCLRVFSVSLPIPRTTRTYGGEIELTIRQISPADEGPFTCSLTLLDDHEGRSSYTDFFITANK